MAVKAARMHPLEGIERENIKITGINVTPISYEDPKGNLWRSGKLRVWAKVQPAKSVGGDFYRYAGTADGLKMAVGDVSDKGVPAALFMARSMSLLPMDVSMDSAPDLGMADLNDALCEGNSACMFVTAVLAQVDTATNTLSFVSGGHPAPVHTQTHPTQ